MAENGHERENKQTSKIIFTCANKYVNKIQLPNGLRKVYSDYADDEENGDREQERLRGAMENEKMGREIGIESNHRVVKAK